MFASFSKPWANWASDFVGFGLLHFSMTHLSIFLLPSYSWDHSWFSIPWSLKILLMDIDSWVRRYLPGHRFALFFVVAQIGDSLFAFVLGLGTVLDCPLVGVETPQPAMVNSNVRTLACELQVYVVVVSLSSQSGSLWTRFLILGKSAHFNALCDCDKHTLQNGALSTTACWLL